jgi:alpha-mannosidase
VDEGTGIVEVYDKSGGLLVKGNELIIEDEVGDLYFHHSRLDRPIHTEGGGGLAYGDFKPVAFNIEQGGLRVKVTLEEEYHSLRWPYRLLDKYKPRVYSPRSIEINKEVIAYRDIPRIDFVTRVNNKHPDVRIMSKFDTGIMQPEYFRETQFGVIREPGKFISDVSFRVPFLSWVDCGSEDRGVTFLSRGAPMNEMGEGYIYLTLLRSVSVLSADGESGPFIPTPDATEIRAYAYEYALYPHPNTWKESQSFRVASAFNHPLTASQICVGDEVPRERSFMELRPDNLLLTAVKKAEDGSGVVIRFYETKGEKTRANLDLAWEISKACHVNLLEEEVADVGFDSSIPVQFGGMGISFSSSLELDVEPFEIVTLKLDFNTQASV